MKPIYWVLIIVLLAGGGFGVWYYTKHRKGASSQSGIGGPLYTPPMQQSQAAPYIAPAAAPKQQSISQAFQATATQVAQKAAEKGLTVLSDKAGDLLSNLMSSWGSNN